MILQLRPLSPLALSLVFFASALNLQAQELPIRLPVPASRATLGPPVDAEPKAKVEAPVEVVPAPAPAPTPGFGGPWYERTKMTGDWFGHRSNLAAHGITLDASWTNFSQGVTSGGRQQDWVYGGHGDYLLNVDGEKAGLWKGFFITAHGETRYGRDVNGVAGALVPPNLTMLFPQVNTDITALTSLKFTQALSENFLVFAGKINMIDEFHLNYIGNRNEGFLSTLIFPTVFLRTIPYSTYGAGFAVLKDGESVLSFMVLDPENRTTTGPTHPFGQGAVLLGMATLPVKPMGLPGHQMIGGSWSSASYRAVDRASFALVPGEGIVAGTETGSWSMFYAFDQAMWVDPCNPKRSWGFFGYAGIADGNPNPIQWSGAVGVGGTSLLRCRTNDTFGAAFYFVNLGSDFKNLLNGPVFGQRNEHGVEVFYNAALTPWCHLTGDLQVVEPSTQRFGTAVIPGVRLKFDF